MLERDACDSSLAFKPKPLRMVEFQVACPSRFNTESSPEGPKIIKIIKIKAKYKRSLVEHNNGRPPAITATCRKKILIV